MAITTADWDDLLPDGTVEQAGTLDDRIREKGKQLRERLTDGGHRDMSVYADEALFHELDSSGEFSIYNNGAATIPMKFYADGFDYGNSNANKRMVVRFKRDTAPLVDTATATVDTITLVSDRAYFVIMDYMVQLSGGATDNSEYRAGTVRIGIKTPSGTTTTLTSDLGATHEVGTLSGIAVGAGTPAGLDVPLEITNTTGSSVEWSVEYRVIGAGG